MSLEEDQFKKAKNYHILGKFKEAQKIYLKLIKKNKKNFFLHNLLGTTYLQLNNFESAIIHLNISIKLNPNFAESYNNLGIVLAEKKQFELSIKNYDKAISLKKDYFDAILNKGIALKNLGKFSKSIDFFKLCLQLNPKNEKIYLNLGNVYVLLKKFKEAKEAFDKAINYNNKYSEAYNNRGELFQSNLNNFELAIKDYEEALKNDFRLKFTYGKMIHAKMHINEWKNFEYNLENIKKSISNKEKVILPFPLLSLIDRPELHKNNAEQYSGDISKNNQNFKKNKIEIKNKIKIAYFSARFYNCATLHNMLDVFKNHNKNDFEIYAFNYGKIDSWTKKINKYFNKFFEVANLSLEEILKLGKQNDIHVAVDLTGYTKNARNEIFLNQIAPIQINFLGYPGTLGSKMYDYILADKIVIPKEFEKYYSEKVLRLPNCYLPTQANQKISSKNFTKQDFGLPTNKFIFGCFNNSYKITPKIFDCWMKILKSSQDSVLWLLQDNKLGQDNLKKEARLRGVDPERILFANRIPVEDHLKRIGLIDLFLDTFPYNAHTTAREAIKMKVPVITIIGESFVSRVAGSLLSNIGLEKLIVNNFEEYIETATMIASNIKKFKEIKMHLKQDKNTKTLFDSKNYTKDLEKIYKSIVT